MNKSTVKIKMQVKYDFEKSCRLLKIGFTELTQTKIAGYVVYQLNATHFQQVFELGVFVSQLTFTSDLETI